MLVNRIAVTGNLGADPDMSFTQSGTAVTKMRIAVYRGKDKDSMWLNVTAWESLGERCSEALKKGQEIYVEGRLDVRTYTAKDGNERTAVDIVASTVQATQRTATGAPKKEYVGATSRANRTADDWDDGDHPF